MVIPLWITWLIRTLFHSRLKLFLSTFGVFSRDFTIIFSNIRSTSRFRSYWRNIKKIINNNMLVLWLGTYGFFMLPL